MEEGPAVHEGTASLGFPTRLKRLHFFFGLGISWWWGHGVVEV